MTATEVVVSLAAGIVLGPPMLLLLAGLVVFRAGLTWASL